MRLSKLFLPAALVFSVAIRASAQTVVYDNGGPNNGGSEMSHWIEAEDFTFGSSSTFNQIRFWDLDIPGGYSGNGFTWWIFSNNLGMPGSIQYTGTATPTREAQGVLSPYTRFQNDLFIASLTLGPGTYWLGLHEGTDYVTRGIFWETTDPTLGNGTLSSHRSENGTRDNWLNNNNELAFELLNSTVAGSVPEPASMALLATGLVGVFGVARRRFVRGAEG